MNIAVCAIAKMENHYIREWVEHYVDIGFNNVILFDNNDKDGERFESVISDYIKSGYVILKNVRGEHSKCDRPSFNSDNLQIRCYIEAYKEYENTFDWILFVDIDEFLVIEETHTIGEFLTLDKFKNANAIKFCWKYFDDNDLVKVENDNYNLMNRFTRHNSAGSNNNQGKCIVKTKLNIDINSAHIFGVRSERNRQNAICVGANGKYENINSCIMLGSNRSDWHKYAWVNHYRYKTIEEFMKNKLNRLYPDQSVSYAKRLLKPTSFWSANFKTKEKEMLANELIGYTENTKQTVIKTEHHHVSSQIKQISTYRANAPLTQNVYNRINSILTNANKQRLLNKLR